MGAVVSMSARIALILCSVVDRPTLFDRQTLGHFKQCRLMPVRGPLR